MIIQSRGQKQFFWPDTCFFSLLNQDIFPDRASERKILDYQVKCPNKEDGCQWIGELRSAEVNVSLTLFFPFLAKVFMQSFRLHLY